jgi:small nuclear ribonucleoprotein (snRNP)-like protein
MAVLRKLYETKSRVKVVIRRVKDIRGYCEGDLIAFDRHYNLVLKNAVEHYSINVIPKEGEVGFGDPSFRKLEPRQRRCGQLFIKGDNVVLITPVQSKN